MKGASTSKREKGISGDHIPPKSQIRETGKEQGRNLEKGPIGSVPKAGNSCPVSPVLFVGGHKQEVTE